MENREWRTIDKSSWPRGEWDSEPDKMQWTDEATGLPCLVVRNPGGHLCGYVGVPDGHPWFQKDYDGCRINGAEWPSVHGGLTFADFCSPRPDAKERGICHVVDAGENDRVWWLGFDCAHCGDLSPKHAADRSAVLLAGEAYRTIDYVRSECRSLAAQARDTQGWTRHRKDVK